MRNIDVMQVKSPTTKIIGIFVSMAAIVALSTVSMNGTTLASTDAKYFIQRNSHMLKNNRIAGSVHTCPICMTDAEANEVSKQE